MAARTTLERKFVNNMRYPNSLIFIELCSSIRVIKWGNFVNILHCTEPIEKEESEKKISLCLFHFNCHIIHISFTAPVTIIIWVQFALDFTFYRTLSHEQHASHLINVTNLGANTIINNLNVSCAQIWYMTWTKWWPMNLKIVYCNTGNAQESDVSFDRSGKQCFFVVLLRNVLFGFIFIAMIRTTEELAR